jgi:REP-associated tyrosine transposase
VIPQPLPVRQALDHTGGFHARFGATFFITICCQHRGVNQLCREEAASVIFETAKRYHVAERWYLELILLMPDHLHMLIAIEGDTDLSDLIRDFKRITAKTARIRWQRNFFDHRLRHDESEDEKAEYIRQNPIRAGLIETDQEWPYVMDSDDLDSK